MKKILCLIMILHFIMLHNIYASSFTTVYSPYKLVENEEIINALKEGNANKFSLYLNDVLALKLPNTEEMRSVSKNQASMNIKMFFDESNIKAFSLSSQRELGTTRYIAGKLIGKREYNITIMIKENNGKDCIVSVRIN